jgi:4-amino-4-deoxy-L-arabinose transferase-like glycosyltransferase
MLTSVPYVRRQFTILTGKIAAFRAHETFAFTAITLLWAFLTLTGLGVAPLFDWDEAAHAEAAAEMMRSGNWLLPTVNGQPFYEKPALLFYLMSASFALFGENAFAARLPSALFTLATALFMRYTGRRLGLSETGGFAALIYLSMLMPAMLAHTAILDAFLNFTMTVSILEFFLWRHGARQGDALLSAFAAGIAVSVKGPVGAIIPVLVIILDRLTTRDLAASLRAFPWLRGLIAFLAGAIPWYALVTLVHGAGFLKRFILLENLARFKTPMEGHSGGWHYYLLALIPCALPWTAWLPWWTTRVALRRKEESGPDLLSRSCLVWTLSVVILFSFSGTKLPHYISIIYPALALGIAGQWLQQGPGRPWMHVATLILLILCVPLAAALISLPELYPRLASAVTHPRALAILSRGPAPGLAIPAAGAVLLAALIVLLSQIRRAPGRRMLVLFALFGIVLQTALVWSIAPWAGRLMQGPQLAVADRVRSQLPGEPLFSLVHVPSISFYSGRIPVLVAGFEVRQRLAKASGPYLLLARTEHLPLISPLSLDVVEQSGDLLLLRHVPAEGRNSGAGP